VDKKKFLKQLGAHIAKTRRKHGYSQDRLYLEAGFSRGTISKIESGLVSPEVYTLARIAQVLGIPLKKLVEFE